MILENNKTYTRNELAEWFQIKPKTFSLYKDKKLEDLAHYADFEVKETKKGNFKEVYIKEVYCGTYMKTYKKDFINFLKQTGPKNPWYIAGEDGVSNSTVITNYYCKINNIPYDGPHYYWDFDEGISLNGKRKISQYRKRPNKEFGVWHYLHRIAKNYYKDIKIEEQVDCSVDQKNPINIKITTSEMLKKTKTIK